LKNGKILKLQTPINLQLQKNRFRFTKMSNDKEGLCFDFVVQKNNPKLMTGHANGVITIL
jgi:hypothetical protein